MSTAIPRRPSIAGKWIAGEPFKDEHHHALVQRFFQDYKTLEHKSVIVEEMEGKTAALAVIPFAGWFVGLYFLWSSPVWTAREKAGAGLLNRCSRLAHSRLGLGARGAAVARRRWGRGTRAEALRCASS